jgi:hypothetical protein
MAKSRASAVVASKRPSIAKIRRTGSERAGKLGAPGQAAGDSHAIIGEQVDDEDEVEIGKRAHALWDAPGGLELEHWLRARSEPRFDAAPSSRTAMIRAPASLSAHRRALVAKSR